MRRWLVEPTDCSCVRPGSNDFQMETSDSAGMAQAERQRPPCDSVFPSSNPHLGRGFTYSGIWSGVIASAKLLRVAFSGINSEFYAGTTSSREQLFKRVIVPERRSERSNTRAVARPSSDEPAGLHSLMFVKVLSVVTVI